MSVCGRAGVCGAALRPVCGAGLPARPRAATSCVSPKTDGSLPARRPAQPRRACHRRSHEAEEATTTFPGPSLVRCPVLGLRSRRTRAGGGVGTESLRGARPGEARQA